MKNDELHLPIKQKWRQMIAAGEKNEEYRDITPYWTKRLTGLDVDPWDDWRSIIRHMESWARADEPFIFRPYKVAVFHCYRPDRDRREIRGFRIGYGNPAWGAPTDREVFIIELGKKLD